MYALNRAIIFYGLLIFIVVMSAVIYYEISSACDTVDFLDMSLEVKSGSMNYIGLNGDTDSLTFGKVSLGADAGKFIKVKYAKDADVEIATEGSLAPWVTATPNVFELKAGEEKEVSFWASVPEDAAAGNYGGKAILCYKDK
ncbi:MAG: hypothetical protein AB1668_04240 [Nanoarchaeota archaeon]